MKINKRLSDPAFMSAAVALFALLALAGAYTAQYGFDLQPCSLCLLQRVPYALLVILGGVGFIMALRKKTTAAIIVLNLSSLVFFSGFVIAFYHNGVEQHWWTSFLEGCRANLNDGGKSMLERIEQAAPVRCDVIPWVDPLIGWSMAAWNTIISAVMAFICLLSAVLIAEQRKA